MADQKTQFSFHIDAALCVILECWKITKLWGRVETRGTRLTSPSASLVLFGFDSLNSLSASQRPYYFMHDLKLHCKR